MRYIITILLEYGKYDRPNDSPEIILKDILCYILIEKAVGFALENPFENNIFENCVIPSCFFQNNQVVQILESLMVNRTYSNSLDIANEFITKSQ